jgi:hypothetical protein
MIFEYSSLLTQWGFFHVFMHVLPFVHLSDLPKDIFLHHFFKLALSHNILLVHAILLLEKNFPEIVTPAHQQTLLAQLFRCIKDNAM